MKRNRQQKFRMKIIQELHLKKDKQEELDHFVSMGVMNYKEIYFYRNYPQYISTIYSMRRFTNSYTKIINLNLYGNTLFNFSKDFLKMGNKICGLLGGNSNV